MKTAFLVVMYNREIHAAATIQALLNADVFFNGSPLVIWNNGPKQLRNKDCEDLISKGFAVEIRETISNDALSVIYNNFMASVDADQYVILDHDSHLTNEYLSAVLALDNVDIAVPVITSEGAVRSPHIKGVFEGRVFTNDDQLLAIGSGLVLNKSIKSFFITKYKDIFDENYYLYGVDFTFFYRAKALQLIEKIQLIPGFEHSLSRLENETAELARFRRIERSYDFGMTLRYYPTKARIKRFVKYSLHFMLGRCRLSYVDIWKAFVGGKHYRAKNDVLK